jgi:hypothetical protein
MRTDIVNVSDDLDASRDGIFLQLNTARTQLGLTEQSLQIQEQGLVVAVEAEKDATSAAQATQEILDETRATLELVREVTKSLGPLDQLDDKINSVVMNVEQALQVARQTLRVAEQTLATGRQALAVARDTLATLKRSEQIQLQLLDNRARDARGDPRDQPEDPGRPDLPEHVDARPGGPVSTRRRYALVGVVLWLLNLLRWARATRPEPLPAPPVGSTTVLADDGTALHAQVAARPTRPRTIVSSTGFLRPVDRFGPPGQRLR